MAALCHLPRPPLAAASHLAAGWIGSLASWRDGATLLWMGARDPRTRKGKVFKGSNGLARSKPANATGWWHRLKSLADIPLAPPHA